MNLGFWVGPDVALRKVPLLLAVVGLVAGLRRNRTATLVLVGLALVLSVLFVLYGLNIGWVEEPHQPPPWGARAAGHDMFRFDVLLLPAVVLLLANGIVALARAARTLLHGDGAAARWSRRTRLGVLALGCALLLVLLAWRGEWRGSDPFAFVASTYNRRFEIKELRFLRAALAEAPRGARLYVLPPAEGVWVDGVDVAPGRGAARRGDGPAVRDRRYVYVNGRQLAVPDLRRTFEAQSAPSRCARSRSGPRGETASSCSGAPVESCGGEPATVDRFPRRALGQRADAGRGRRPFLPSPRGSARLARSSPVLRALGRAGGRSTGDAADEGRASPTSSAAPAVTAGSTSRSGHAAARRTCGSRGCATSPATCSRTCALRDGCAATSARRACRTFV